MSEVSERMELEGAGPGSRTPRGVRCALPPRPRQRRAARGGAVVEVDPRRGAEQDRMDGSLRAVGMRDVRQTRLVRRG